ncbi:MAG: glycerophosphodiester phosphodiesterase [Armatimonadetes bacterium]|nr:glycerophosphodiester phosphodiesterase [Armatimonadota bacterium]MDE2205004.1 glycerophosphodiester phosphodiesterase [Armatimonadota bacterium]
MMHGASIWRTIAHRGAPANYPANTISGFRHAVALGCGSVECDVRLSRDGVLVLCHDDEAQDSSGRRWSVADHTASELGALELGAGEGVPTLDELVSEMAGRGGLMADMKVFGHGVEQLTADSLRPLGASHALISGISREVAPAFRAAWPELRLSTTRDAHSELPAGQGPFEAWAQRLNTDGVSWEYPLATAERVATLHEYGVSVYCWTVDNPATIQTLLAIGVDGVISNRPDLLAQVAAEFP